MFSSLTFACDQIRQQGLTECCIEDSSGSDRLGYFEGKPNDVAAWLESSIGQLSGPLVVKAWDNAARKGGNPGEKRKGGVIHRWRLYGMHGNAAPVVPGAAPAPAVDVKDAVAMAVESARKDWTIQATQDELKRLSMQLDELRAQMASAVDDDGDDDDDDESAPAQADLMRELLGMVRGYLAPTVPAPTAPAAAMTGTPAAPTDEDARLLAAIRTAKAQHPEQMQGYIDQLLATYGPK